MDQIFRTRKGAAFSTTVTVYQQDGVTLQPLGGAAVSAEAVENEGDATPAFAYTAVVQDAAGILSLSVPQSTILTLKAGIAYRANLLIALPGGSPEEYGTWLHVIDESRTL